MRPSLLHLLVSPDDGAPLTLVDPIYQEDEIFEGSLLADRTGQTFPIKNGVPYFAPQAVNFNPTALRFGYQWKRQAAGAFEKEMIYGQSATQELNNFLQATRLSTKDLPGLRIADVGCGSGRLSSKLAEAGAEVVAIDISAAVEVVRAGRGHVRNLHVLQADLFHLPFRDRSFDVIWSNGVIHHTPNPAATVSALARKVAVGGRLAIYVYPHETSIYKLVRRWTPGVNRWPLPMVSAYSAVTALFIYFLRILAGKRQPYRQVRFHLFDTLACPYLSMHSPAEVTNWFEDNQFYNIAMAQPPITALGIKRA
jgi:SAM-dependent methyltransferase